MLRLTLSFAILAVAAAIGALLAVPFLRGKGARRAHWAVTLGHGVLGTAGLGVLLAGLWQGLPASGMGTAGFGPGAAVLLALALGLGISIGLASFGRRRPAAALVAVHASLAIAGLVVLWALVSVG
ncbi:MAG TPA: hypothetical protein VGG57_21140 [Stellaceae bacterium]|jgi:hypothetical protein